jgi:hypothetical protein
MNPSAEEILNMKEPGELFSDNIKAIKDEYSNLAKVWHPDFNGDSKISNDVMIKINLLYKECTNMLQLGKWIKPGLIRLFGKDKIKYQIKYKTSYVFELGTMYISDTVLFYLIDEEHKKFVENYHTSINNLTFANDKMKAEMQKYLPKIVSEFETIGNQLGIVIEKSPDLFLLRDVLKFYAGKIPAEHAAWILSSLYNMACYIDYAGLSHNAITLENYFISAKEHSGALLGGWWYAVSQNTKMIGVPEKVYLIMPPNVKDKKLGNITTDLESIRLLGRELLGDRNGTKLMEMKAAPIAMIDWVRGAASDSALKDYRKWDDILDLSFGKRCFVNMDLSKI